MKRSTVLQAEMNMMAKQAGLDPLVMNALQHADALTVSSGYGRLMAKLGSAILCLGGHEGSPVQTMYSKLAASNEWSDQEEALVLPVYEVMAKQASPGAALPVAFLQNATDLGSKVMNGGAGIVSAILLASAMVGGGAGSLNWYLKQQQQEDDVDNEELKIKARTYADMAHQIEGDVRLRRLKV